jgi:hypothetical protein
VLVLARAANETSFTIGGYSASRFAARLEGGSIDSIERNAATGMFRLKLHAAGTAADKVTLTLTTIDGRSTSATSGARTTR